MTAGLSLNGSITSLLTGTITANDIVKVKVLDAGLTGGSETASYTVLFGDTFTSVATGIVAAINNDTNLQAIGVTATSSGAALNVTSVSTNATTYQPWTSNSAATAPGSEKIIWNLPPNGSK